MITIQPLQLLAVAALGGAWWWTSRPSAAADAGQDGPAPRLDPGWAGRRRNPRQLAGRPGQLVRRRRRNRGNDNGNGGNGGGNGAPPAPELAYRLDVNPDGKLAENVYDFATGSGADTIEQIPIAGPVVAGLLRLFGKAAKVVPPPTADDFRALEERQKEQEKRRGFRGRRGR